MQRMTKKVHEQWQVSEATRKTLTQTIHQSLHVLKSESISLWNETRYSVFFANGKTTGVRPSNPLFPHGAFMNPMQASAADFARIRDKVNKVKKNNVLSRQELN